MKNNVDLMALLQAIPDPEIPVLSVVELGVVREAKVREDGRAVVKITPTYSGCPAMKRMEQDIKKKLEENGFADPIIEMVYYPAWTTDWISDEARQKLEQYGIAPPEKTTVDKSVITLHPKNIRCPRCKSHDVEMVSQFGSTACKALYKCNACLEPFDYFKCI
ncbi:MAG: phenylacetate-CoA oxygenase subunit PaaJ [Bacteroidia bacterium]|nr:phenylacetate-CoA oxygenase subunit PaaJ [Bacteroidia bacterium]